MNDETPKQKNFALSEEDIKPLVHDPSACFATDMIVVDHQGIGYMYREEPDFEEDSGWRFFGGEETADYLSDPENLGIYTLNTIANYDPAIVPLLDAPVGSEFERDEDGEFVELREPEGGESRVEWIDGDSDN